MQKDNEDQFTVTTNRGTKHRAPIIVIAAGLGCFEPRKPPVEGLLDFEDKGVEYIIKDPEFYRGKKVVISGGGDSALDWTVFLADVASEVTLVHRRSSFRGHPDSVQKVMDLAEAGKITLLTNAEVVGVGVDGDADFVAAADAKTSVGLGFTWWTGGAGLNTSISTNYDYVMQGTDNSTNLSVVVGFGF